MHTFVGEILPNKHLLHGSNVCKASCHLSVTLSDYKAINQAIDIIITFDFPELGWSCGWKTFSVSMSFILCFSCLSWLYWHMWTCYTCISLTRNKGRNTGCFDLSTASGEPALMVDSVLFFWCPGVVMELTLISWLLCTPLIRNKQGSSKRGVESRNVKNIC